MDRSLQPVTRPGAEFVALGEKHAAAAAARAVPGTLQRVGLLLDDVIADRPKADVSIDELHEVNKEFQCMKLVVNRKAVDIVDRALTVSGGAGYMTASPLSRLYRDVRAGPFMHPIALNAAYEYIGQVTLGLAPAA